MQAAQRNLFDDAPVLEKPDCTSIQVDGFTYRSWWGGCEHKGNESMGVGKFCDLRDYHKLELITVGGKDWIKETNTDAKYPDIPYLEYYSTCGKFHISPDLNYKSYLVFEASTWRKHMRSTFGNYTAELRNTEFQSFEAAAIAVANLKVTKL